MSTARPIVCVAGQKPDRGCLVIEEYREGPNLHADVFLAPNAFVIGRVAVGQGSSIWYGAVVRGDLNAVEIGAGTNIQDLSLVCATEEFSTTVGDRVSIEPRCVLRGCRISSDCLVGTGSAVLDGAVVGQGSVIAPGAVLPPGQTYPASTLIEGTPAEAKRPISATERDLAAQAAQAASVRAPGCLRPAAAVLSTIDSVVGSLRLHEIEREAIRLALVRTGNHQSKAAALLGIHRDTLRRKIAEHGL
jgi:carbonic anhydrase/acetyltransferase-like protein (isoleucine patch superfamily)